MIKLKIVLLLLVTFVSCSVLRNKRSLFRLKEAAYQSWEKNEKERGTQIRVTVYDVKPGIEFDSIIFRGRRLPLFKLADKDTLRLTTFLNAGTSGLPLDQTVVDKPDQLLYRYQGKRYHYPISQFRREAMKYVR